MNDEELAKYLDRREEGVRSRLEAERKERELAARIKTYDWLTRGMAGAGIILLLVLWSALVAQCEVGREIDRIRDVVKPSNK